VLRRPRIASLLAIAVAVALASGSVAAPARAAELPDPYYPADGNVGYDVRHYDIHDRYRFGDRHLAGVTTLRLVPQEELTTFSLDLLLDVDAVHVDGVAADFEKTNVHELAITPDTPLAAGEPVDVRVRYQGFPSEIGWQGERNWLANDHEVVTMNEPHMAAWWFPSNDHPSDKARYDIRVTTGKGRQVISNGVRKGRTVHGRTATTHWRMADPMATYLAFFAAGDFTIDKGTASGLRYYNAVSQHLSAVEEQAAVRTLHSSARITAWLQKELGDYPFASTGGLVTSLPVNFALENQSRPTYSGYVSIPLLVHELAHQWFGDSVAVARWQDIWINEGFATYMEFRYAETHGGTTTKRRLHQLYRYYLHDDYFWSHLDIADPCSGAGPCPFGDLFDIAVYVRGGMALAALRSRIGQDDFRRLLRRWASVHEGGNATSEEFEAMAETVSGADLDNFFQAWLHGDEPPPNTSSYGL